MTPRNDTRTGTCFCGAVEVEVTGTPEAMGYCHCESCRRWSAAPVNAFSLWKPDAVRVTRGEDRLGQYAKTPTSRRRWCRNCGGHVLSEHPGLGLVDVYAAILDEFEFAPGVHVHCTDRVLAIADHLPRYRDLPEPMGSGVLL